MARYLTVLGTQSHVGKSILVTALCRILKRRGYRVAPFKAQNMSNNSWITADGSEIGIAQAIQAFAAGAEPRAEMNPVLLKPKGNMTSQVVVLGKPLGDRVVGQYYESIESMMAIALNALYKLSEDYDVIVVEGAGGAAEINLYDRDIANIPLARAIHSPVLLVGDIERGGVFASLYGTIALLPPGDRELVKGLIINKFCGDPSLLGSGVGELEKLTGVPVMGIVPYSGLRIPSEDSVSLGDKKPEGLLDVDIAVVRFPLISNFTDFEALERIARVRYVSLDDSLGRPDIVILPGSKNTVSDLKMLKNSPLASEICSLASDGVPVIGICGGYQMLGRQVVDSGIEGGMPETIDGLGLLPVTTVFDRYEKCTCQSTKTVTGAGPLLAGIRGSAVTGYEIHMGQTRTDSPAFGDDGCVSDSGTILGTYLHGIFNNASFTDAVLKYACERKGLRYVRPEGVRDPYDELADIVESAIDLDAIIRLIESQDKV
ncbi:cobyric acid synthase [Methanocella arvoryzae]|uniref:Probable cobyric acid synthase n=1 Tax=Methanocella arvoryzae (strain DSM 22066 / NBRC 105507 / MRE50) TaxID=351160 RepID=COBQ_METAR|nr:cobyric acid synthase [Methanocella arvoryzae]Q0W1N4.1 RecName: Full=Probable cobyric acid synthase [Methanocella arvoryzae MRE50]CAJ37709.1 cobyric acid synthase [Methanocella arvoryzae MRE50]